MAFNINDFVSRGLPLGGARPTLFDVTVRFPAGPGFTSDFINRGQDRLRFTCRASTIPASNISSINIPYFGRTVKVSGDRTFDDWQVTVMNDEDYVVRRAFEEWHSAMNRIVENRKVAAQPGEQAPTGYKGRATVTQYGKTGNTIAQYIFENLFPTNVDAMGLDWEATGQIQTFGVRFAYDYWLPFNATGSSEDGSQLNSAGSPGSTSA
jgi:hypothetical protein